MLQATHWELFAIRLKLAWQALHPLLLHVVQLAVHSMQTVEFPPAEYEPAEQFWQLVPLIRIKLTTHSRQVLVELLVLEAEQLEHPCEQLVQAKAPPGPYWPAGHCTQEPFWSP